MKTGPPPFSSLMGQATAALAAFTNTGKMCVTIANWPVCVLLPAVGWPVYCLLGVGLCIGCRELVLVLAVTWCSNIPS